MIAEMIVLPDRYDAIISDLDGVVTRSATVHAAAWKDAFDEFLAKYSGKTGEAQDPFDPRHDYLRYVDGLPRYEGVKSFLDSRGIKLPWGSPEDLPDRETVCGIGNDKNRKFRERIQRDGVERYDSSVDFFNEAKKRGIHLGLVSSSKNARALLEAAHLDHLFEVIVDGVEAERQNLAGKPQPDTFLEAARRLSVSPARAIVIEDAVSGVAAGHRGGFGCVLGVARNANHQDLHDGGADVVVNDLGDVKMTHPKKQGPQRRKAALPDAIRLLHSLPQKLGNRQLAVFLDFDGTLSPIVDDPNQADLPEATRRSMATLAQCVPTAVVSGRDLQDVKRRVGLENLWYAGSHGFEIEGPKGETFVQDDAQATLPKLEEAEQKLRSLVGRVAGAELERKSYSIAIHVRRVDPGLIPVVAAEVRAITDEIPQLRVSRGRKVFDLGPNIPWDKGRAVHWILDVQHLDESRAVPLYIGDDVTDEDAFGALSERGLAIAVMGGPHETHAQYLLQDPYAVRQFLDELHKTMREADLCQSGI